MIFLCVVVRENSNKNKTNLCLVENGLWYVRFVAKNYCLLTLTRMNLKCLSVSIIVSVKKIHPLNYCS